MASPAPSATKRRSRVVELAAALTVLIVLPLALLAYPLIHNYHLAPLARLAGRVHAGDPCVATARAFAEYHARRSGGGNTDVQFLDGSTRDSQVLDRLDPPRRLLDLYDLTPFGDVQLTVICDPAGQRVERVLYMGD